MKNEKIVLYFTSNGDKVLADICINNLKSSCDSIDCEYIPCCDCMINKRNLKGKNFSFFEVNDLINGGRSI